MKKLAPVVLAVSFALVASWAQAVTLRVSNQGDVQSMDPHSLNESLQLSFDNNIYEPLIERDKNMGLAPALATKSGAHRIPRSRSRSAMASSAS